MKTLFSEKNSSQYGFTLIELLTVISIIALLSTIIIGQIQDSREKARIKAGMQQDSTIKHAIGDRLVSEWTFDEGSGNTVYDSSGVLNGSRAGNWSWIEGVFDSALTFSSNGFVQLPHDTGHIDFIKSDNITITGWFKVQADGWDVLFYSGHWNWTKGLMISIAGPGAGNGEIYSGAGGAGQGAATWVSTQKTFNDDKWHFVAVTWNGEDFIQKVYVDGTLQALNDHACGTLDSSRTSLSYASCNINPAENESFSGGSMTTPRIGMGNGIGSWGSLRGSVDQVRIYNAVFDDTNQ